MMLRWPPAEATDATSPEFWLAPSGEGARCVPAEWEISEEGPALMLHRPTRLLFEIYLRAAAEPSQLSMFDLAARLVHVCDGCEVPAAVQLTAIGHSAIFAYTMLSESLNFTDPEFSDQDIPF
jgi:hypothetical protein